MLPRRLLIVLVILSLGLMAWAATKTSPVPTTNPDATLGISMSTSATSQTRPADREQPAAGVCTTPAEDTVLVTVSAGTLPEPRCIQVTADQRLQFKNGTDDPIHIQLGPFEATLAAGESRLFNVPCGDYLADGVHHVSVSAGSVPEIWVVTPIITTSTYYPGGLSVEEHAFKDPPDTEPLSFRPLQGLREDILRNHRQDRDDRYPDRNFFEDGHAAVWADWKGGKLVAKENWIASNNQVRVDVTFRNQTIYTIPLGSPSPLKALQGLWTKEDHWFLEVANVTQQLGPLSVTGRVIWDGVSLNETYGYEESFGFQLLADKPFFFFRKEGKTGISYDGQEIPLDYDEVPHYGCCSAAALNPIVAKDMMAFFAQRDGLWYYVEIGVFAQSTPAPN